jgi:hypothetical protein
VDPDVLAQFGRPIFAYAGGIGPSLSKVRSSNLYDESFLTDGRGYRRDPNRFAPHNLIVDTAAIYARTGARDGVPRPVFSYSAAPAPGTPGTTVHVPISTDSDVTWQWNPAAHSYARAYGAVPALESDGSRISAVNVVVQLVAVTPSPYVEDPTGAHQNFVTVVGSGAALVCRLGTCVAGTWRRPSMSSVTAYVDASGRRIDLAPGNTWVELAPTGTAVTHA